MRTKENNNMSKVSYANLKLKVDTSVDTFDFNNQTIEVLKYLPIEDKYDLIMITLQKAEEDGIYNDIKLDMYFHLHLVMMYTDIIFSSEDRLDDFALYDALVTNDVINLVVNAMDEDEYTSLFTMVEELSDSVAEFDKSVAGMLNNLMKILPEQASKLQEAIENTDKDKLVAMADIMKNKD